MHVECEPIPYDVQMAVEKLPYMKEHPNIIKSNTNYLDDKRSPEACVEEMDDGTVLNKHLFTSIHALSDEVLEYIFAFLSVRDRIETELVCKRWQWLGKCRPWSWPKKLLLEHNLSFKETDQCYLKTQAYFGSTSKLTITPPVQNHFDLQTSIPYDGYLTDTSVQPPSNLLSLLSRCGISLKELELGRWDCDGDPVPDKTFEIVAISCPNLVAIKLVGIPLKGSNLKTLAQHCPKLKTVTLCNSFEIDEDMLTLLFQSCKALECFGAQYCWKLVTGECFGVINRNLQILRLAQCVNLEPIALKKLMMRCKHLQELRLTNCCLLDQVTLLQVLNHYRETLKALSLDHYTRSKEWCEGLRVLHNLEELSVSGCTIVGDRLCCIVATYCPKLRVLNVSDTSVTDTGLRFLTSATCLIELDISETHVHGSGIKTLAKQGRLEKVSAVTCPYVADANEAFSCLAEQCPNLRILDVSGNRGISNWLVTSFCQSVRDGVLKGPVRLIVADTCVTDDVEACKGLEVVENTYNEQTQYI